jgi:hypothetical protein
MGCNSWPDRSELSGTPWDSHDSHRERSVRAKWPVHMHCGMQISYNSPESVERAVAETCVFDYCSGTVSHHKYRSQIVVPLMSKRDSRAPVLWIALFVGTVLPSWACVGQDAEERDVATLISQLGDDDRKVRLQAEKTLLALGPEALSRLPQNDEIVDLAARDAVRRIRNELERQRAHADLSPTHVSLQGEFTLERVLQELNQQTKNTLETTDIPAQMLTRRMRGDFEDTPFWEALEHVLRAANLTYAEQGSADAISLRPVRAGEPECQTNSKCVGVFRITAQVGRLREFSAENGDRILPVHLELKAEPRLHVLSLRYADADFKITTTNQRHLSPFTPDARSSLPLGDGRRTVRFISPQSAGSGPYNLRGRFRVLVAADTRPVTFFDLPNSIGTSKRLGQVAATLKSVQFDEPGAESREARVHVAVAYDTGGPAFASHRTWMLGNPAFLQDEDLRLIKYSTRETTLQSDGVIATQYRFRNLKRSDREYRFVYETPTLITTVSAPVAFVSLSVQD